MGLPSRANSPHLGQVLIVHALEEHMLLEGVHRNIHVLVPYRIEVIADNLRPRLGSILDQHANVWVALPAKSALNILDIGGLLDVHAHDTNRRLVLCGTVERAGHVERLPLRRHPNAARLAPGEGPPVPHALPRGGLLRLEQVVEADGEVPNDRVLAEVAVVNDLDGDCARVPICAEELLCGLPDGRQRVLDERRRMDPFVCAKVDFAVGVDVLGEWCETTTRVQFLRLVDDEADNTRGRVGRWVENPFDHLRLENRIECPMDVLARTS
jgi:hypothetical protein